MPARGRGHFHWRGLECIHSVQFIYKVGLVQNICERMSPKDGRLWLSDRPITIVELKRVFELLEEDWEVFKDDAAGRVNTGLTACMFISSSFAALRGEEIGRVDIGAMREHWNKALNFEDAPHVPLMLAGRFKREIGEKLFAQPLAMESISQIAIALWFRRMLQELEVGGVVKGPLFRNKKGGRASVADLDIMLHGVLKRVRPMLFHTR
jgi:hypothetical protein